jgi:UV DNA damage endonuclease
MIRLGLCCIFREQPIKFATTTATAISCLSRLDALAKLSRLCLANANSLRAALEFCAFNGIGCFRVNSQILPLKTHPTCGYEVADLPDGGEIIRRFKQCGKFVKKHKLRTCFHPDQFVVLNSPRPDVVDNSVAELEYQAEVAGWIGADVINIHGGGAYGDKAKALANFASNLDRLSLRVRRRLTVENDDRLFTPADLFPICKATGIPLVYDVHHHRCHSDGMTVEQATRKALATWDREPLFHLSSPLQGWDGPNPERHHDFINVTDFPDCWRRKRITVEVEAKAKELAVAKLRSELQAQRKSK